MNAPKQYADTNRTPRRDFQEFLSTLGPRLMWGEECDVLDVGCGSGDVTRDVLRPSLQCSKPRIVGIDVSQVMVDFARTSCTDELKFLVMDIATSQNPRHLFPNGFDKIYSNFCLHWVQDQRRAMQNIYDLLKPGGEIILTILARTPLFQAYLNLGTTAAWSSYMKNFQNAISPYHNSEHPEKEMRDILETLGFTVEICECPDKWCKYQNYEDLRVSYAPLIPFKFASPEMHEKFVDAVTEDIASQIEIQDDGIYVVKFSLVQVFARKPTTVTQ